jgi:hypothetical protein
MWNLSFSQYIKQNEKTGSSVKCYSTCHGSRHKKFTSNCSLPLFFEKFLHPQGLLGLAAKEK